MTFWERVRKGDGCWEWTGFVRKDGYGQFGRSKAAYRAAWELANGPIPPGAHVLHSCDNRLCVRPDHLRLGTHGDNMADMAARGRSAARRRVGLGLKRRQVRAAVFKGVAWDQRPLSKPWMAQVVLRGKKFYLGRFKTAVEAALAYDAGAARIQTSHLPNFVVRSETEQLLRASYEYATSRVDGGAATIPVRSKAA